MNKNLIRFAAAGMVALAATSCLKDDTNDFTDWRELNDAYVASINTSEYQRFSPDWAPRNEVYIKWHNDRSLTADNLVPMSNSTVQLKYELEDINGTLLQNSYRLPDSTYTTKPQGNIIGFEIALTTMHVGDSATLIIPYSSAFGALGNSPTVQPYSTLIYRIKIKGIKAYEKQ